MLLGAKPGVLGKLVKLVHKLDLVKMYIVYIQMYGSKVMKEGGAGRGSQGPPFMPERCTGLGAQVHT